MPKIFFIFVILCKSFATEMLVIDLDVEASASEQGKQYYKVKSIKIPETLKDLKEGDSNIWIKLRTDGRVVNLFRCFNQDGNWTSRAQILQGRLSVGNDNIGHAENLGGILADVSGKMNKPWYLWVISHRNAVTGMKINGQAGFFMFDYVYLSDLKPYPGSLSERGDVIEIKTYHRDS